METSTSAGRGPFPPTSWCGALVVVVAMLSSATTAMAASSWVRDHCESALPDLEGPAADLSGLTFRIVDLGASEHDDAPQASTGLTESMAPLLFLTPRVTSILEDVFADSAAVPERKAAETAAGTDDHTSPLEKGALPGSPVAGIDARGNTPDTYESLSRVNDATSLPRFQRQMYRTDI